MCGPIEIQLRSNALFLNSGSYLCHNNTLLRSSYALHACSMHVHVRWYTREIVVALHKKIEVIFTGLSFSGIVIMQQYLYSIVVLLNTATHHVFCGHIQVDSFLGMDFQPCKAMTNTLVPMECNNQIPLT